MYQSLYQRSDPKASSTQDAPPPLRDFGRALENASPPAGAGKSWRPLETHGSSPCLHHGTVFFSDGVSLTRTPDTGFRVNLSPAVTAS